MMNALPVARKAIILEIIQVAPIQKESWKTR